MIKAIAKTIEVVVSQTELELQLSKSYRPCANNANVQNAKAEQG